MSFMLFAPQLRTVTKGYIHFNPPVSMNAIMYITVADSSDPDMYSIRFKVGPEYHKVDWRFNSEVERDDYLVNKLQPILDAMTMLQDSPCGGQEEQEAPREYFEEPSEGDTLLIFREGDESIDDVDPPHLPPTRRID